MTAQDAINKIKSERITFMGVDVQKYNYALEIRRELQAMAERGEISPGECFKALKITWPDMTPAQKAAEQAELL
jgi:hypothetical protein